MFTVNLEKELLKQNNKYLSLEEERFVSFVENTLQESAERDKETLKRAGFDELLKDANKAKAKNDLHDYLRAKYGNKLFTFSQIKKICLKYNLRFLPTKHYKGSFPLELPQKINEHERKYSELSLKEKYGVKPDGYYICAPTSSFKLAEKPKDPLLFHKVAENEELYALVYKWGDDLSIFNMAVGFFKSFRYLLGLFISIFFNYQASLFITSSKEIGLTFIVACVIGIVSFVFVMYNIEEGNYYRQQWNSPYK